MTLGVVFFFLGGGFLDNDTSRAELVSAAEFHDSQEKDSIVLKFNTGPEEKAPEQQADDDNRKNRRDESQQCRSAVRAPKEQQRARNQQVGQRPPSSSQPDTAP